MTEETEVTRRDPMVVSLDLELSTIEAAMRGAEILADYQMRQGYLDEESEVDAPECVFSILSLLGGRLEQVRRVIRGEEDPERLWGAHNAISIPESLADVDGDIVLFPWNARGMPLVLARPSGWGLDPKEVEERQALGLEGRKAKEPRGRKAKSPEGRKAKSPEGRKVKSPEGRKVKSPEGRKVKSPEGRKVKGWKAKEPKEQAPQALNVQGAELKETPPVAPGPT